MRRSARRPSRHRAPRSASGGDIVETVVFLQLYAPVLLHVTSHFFVGFGPNAYLDIRNTTQGVSNLRRFLGASSVVGGWFV